jgi:hypothetical protein
MARKLAVKRLAAVEIDPSLSHQHEFHAGKLKPGLGFGEDKQSGELRLQVVMSDGAIVDDVSSYTLYDARAGNPKRSEWHLYYTSKVLPEVAAPGDLLVLFRPDDESTDVLGYVLACGSNAERRMLQLLELSADFDVERFLIVEPDRPSPDQASQLALALWAGQAAPASQAELRGQHPLLSQAAELDKAPSAVEMALAAADLATVSILNPDSYLVAVLDLETDLYFSIEAVLQTKRLRALIDEGGAVPEVLDWAMRVHQARRSRRGQSLQLHFARLLESRRIAYTAQCITEQGEKPDFVIPGCDAYHNRRFTGALRMVACKSTSKERWRQVLNEADRIPVKYLLTLDPALTAPTINQMTRAGLEPFLPAAAIAKSYALNPMRNQLGTVADLLDKLEAAIV